MPVNFNFVYIPLKFNNSNSEFIRLQIAEKYSDFFLDKNSVYFLTQTKIFAYKNKMNLTRILLVKINDDNTKDYQ